MPYLHYTGLTQHLITGWVRIARQSMNIGVLYHVTWSELL